ncbi:MAG: hypothetical protein ACE144_09655 [Thermodesulfobacteriota bacterium]
MKRLIGILLSFSFVMAMGCAYHEIPVYSSNQNCKPVTFSPGLEPQGFNGVKWETELSSLDRMKFCRKESSHGGIDFYLRAGDGFKLKNGKVLPIQYGFWRGRFYVGLVTTEQASDWNALKEAVFEKFGVGAKPFTNQEEYLWIGKNATMALRYDGLLKMGTYYIRSHSMEKQMS